MATTKNPSKKEPTPLNITESTQNIRIDHWKKFYDKTNFTGPSSFAIGYIYYLLHRKVNVVELGCGEGRDLKFLRAAGVMIHGVDSAGQGPSIITQDVNEYIKNTPCPPVVYTRFFWHSIDRDTQLAILKWVKGILLIEARTTDDSKTSKMFGEHYRNYVSVPQLVNDLKDHGFEITSLCEGRDLAKFKNENPHVVRAVVKKVS